VILDLDGDFFEEFFEFFGQLGDSLLDELGEFVLAHGVRHG
jgi:hypothetical protein